MSTRGETTEAVAIVGIGCRFPGAIGSPRQFWDFLTRRGDAVSNVPPERWDADALFAADPATPGRTYARRGGFLAGIDQFDPAFFGISPREAAHIDPQQRLLLETAHEAMEDAGERWDDPALRNTGVFVGVFIHDYQHIQFADRELLNAHTGTGTAMSIAANRISYVFDLHGPSIAVDTACSSSLVAVDLACKAILNGDCEYALAGGANVILKPEMTIAMSKATMLSKDGYCRSFDAGANGYVRGEGAGLVLLKRRSAALHDRNRVYSVILGSGVNSDGQTKGISVPNGEAQARLSRRVLEEAGVAPHTVGYVEAHGTGTPVGDPIEAAALGSVFSLGRGESEHCLLGSVKSNIGHLESASGVAGLIKAALCLSHREIPASLHFEAPNPAIDFDRLKLRVVREQEAWLAGSNTPRRAAVNSFGFGGTNAHVLLEEAPARAEAATSFDGSLPQRLILPMGANDASALRALSRGYAEALREGCDGRDLLYTVSQRRSHGRCRAAVVAENIDDLQQQLAAFAEGATPKFTAAGERNELYSGRPVFVFSGMGSQWWAMGRELLRDQPVFRSELERVDTRFLALAGWSVVEQLMAAESASRIHQTQIAQPAIFAIQCGLTALFKHWGVEPAATLGHSVGEAAALHAAGILTLDDAVTVIYHRSRLQSTTAGSGGMLAVGIDVNAATDLLRGFETSVAIAAVNSYKSLTLSGEIDALRELRARLEADGRFAQPLAVEVPYHSAKMDSIRAELLECLRAIRPSDGRCTYYSTADGKTPRGVIGDGAYWWRNVREPVLFADAMAAAIQDGSACFLEIGPHPVLRTPVRECLEHHGVRASVVSSLQRNRSDLDRVAGALAELHVAGTSIEWDRVLGSGRLVSLPPYPWQRARHWSESEHAEQQRKGLARAANLRSSGTRHRLLGEKIDLPTPTWLGTLRLEDHRYLVDHKVQGAIVFPGTGYLEMALQTLAEAGTDLLARGECLLLADVEIGRALHLTAEGETRLETRRSNDRWEVYGCTGEDGTWVRHAAGKCRREKLEGTLDRLDVGSIRARCSNALPASYGYRLFRDVGLEYGPSFQAIQELWYGPGEALARLELPAALVEQETDEPSSFLFHPALLDACLHTLFGALNLNGEDSDRRGNVFLPVSVRQLRVHRRPTHGLFSHARLHTREARHFEADLRVYDEAGELVAEVVGLRCQATEDPTSVAEARRLSWLFEYEWKPSALGGSEALSGRWLVVVPAADHAIVEHLRARGAECVVAVPGETFAFECGEYSVSVEAPESFERLMSSVTESAPLAGVVHALCLASSGEEHSVERELQVAGAGSLMHLVQAMSRARQPDKSSTGSADASSPRLWVLTKRTQPVKEGDVIELPHSTVWGLRRVIANEHPVLAAAIADLDGTHASYSALADSLLTVSNEDELAFREGERFVHRLERHLPILDGQGDPGRIAPSRSQRNERVELRIQKPGELKSAIWTRLPPLVLGDHDVEIAIEATGVNFKDVMKATGVFPPRLIEGNLWSRETLGMECAGRITRVGREVRGLSPGDPVMALAPRSFASHAITRAELVVQNPGLAPEVAAGIPVAFLTAAMGLERLAGLQPGERVLIHAGSGGVGQAAIQIARAIGARIFATAGSEEKRRLVRELGVEHVFDSRSIRFANGVLEATRGEGVDVVLNSLAGEAITQSLSLLRDYGRFVEIGKMDLDRDFPLGLRPFTRSLSFHSLDLDRMLAQRVATCGEVLSSIRDRLVEGVLRPLPVSVHRAADVSDAFHTMAAAKHTGKLVIDLRASGALPASRGVSFQSDASYVISGGLGGFGLQLARWMAARGAGRLILLGRRGLATPGAEEACRSLEELGAEVQVESCDVANAVEIRQMLERVPAELPLRGVFHAAAVLDDALIRNLDFERYERTFRPKALGAWNLHEQTLGSSLDYFMCFSSMASVLGNQGSGNYCAANAFVDSLAHYRRRRGLPALTVNWGVIADVGMAADEDFYRQNLERNGLSTIHSDHCLEMLDLLLVSGRAQTTVCPIDFETWLRFNPAGREGRLRGLLAEANQGVRAMRAQSNEEAALRQTLTPLDAEAQQSLAEQTIRELLALVFRTQVEDIDPRRSLTALGADSLMAIEIKNRLDAIGLAMSVTQLLGRSSVTTLATALLAALGCSGAKPGERQDAPSAEPAGSTWLLRRAPRDAKLRLFCFPYAGGGPGVYNSWPEAFPDWIEVVVVNLPGRGARANEPSIESIAQAADCLVPELLPLLDRPFALFGHCMGAILMYEVAERLSREHGKPAAHLFASGCMAPHLYNSPLVYEQDDAAFLDILRLISFSGTRALIEDPELRRTMFPQLRADFRAVAHYGDRFEARPPLDSPITGLAASNDLFAAPKAMEAWTSYTSSRYDLAQLSGDHYFLESDRDTIIKMVLARLGDSTPETLPAVHGVTWRRTGNEKVGRAPLRANDRVDHGDLAAGGHGSLNGNGANGNGSKARKAGLRVLCFPPVGIRADEFPLPSSGEDDVAYEAVDWRCRGEGEVSSVAAMAGALRAAIGDRVSGRTVFFGHCLGAIVAYELALLLQREFLAGPEHFLAIGTVGPHLYVAPDAHNLPTSKLLELLTVLKYPFAERLRTEPAFLAARIEMIRADLEAMATYQYQPTAALKVPITAVCLRHDLWSYPLRTATWREHTERSCNVIEWPGDHYYSMQHPERIHQLVRTFDLAHRDRRRAFTHQAGENHESTI